jgi:PAS domain S-box-containing protein
MKKTEALFRAVMDNAPIEIVLKDLEGRYLQVNLQWQKSYGLTNEEVRGKLLGDIFPEEFANSISARQLEVVETGKAVVCEDRLPHPDGVHDYITVMFPVHDAAGKIVNSGAMSVDITERKRAEEALRESEQRFRVALGGSPIIVATIDRDLRYTWIYNPVAGFAPEYLIGKRDDEVGLEPESAAPLIDFKRRVLESGVGAREEFNLRLPEGDATFDIVAEPLREPGGAIVGLTVAATDITERKRVVAALRESEERLGSVARNLPGALFRRILHPDGTLEYPNISGGIRDFLGITPEEFMAHPERVRSYFHPDDLPVWQQALDASAADLSPLAVELRYRLSTGGYGWVRQVATVRRAENGDIIWDGIGLDITEEKRAEEEIRKLNEELEGRIEERTAELRAAQADVLRQERLATLGQLTATVSHELRNPLGSIRTSTFILRENLQADDPRMHRALERIERNVVRCDRIVDELLDFTRISDIKAQPTALDDWLTAVLEAQTLPPGVSLRRDFGLAEVLVPLDRDRFRRAVINVVDNACQAMFGEGDAQGKSRERLLTLCTQQRNGRIEVVIEDTGPGIAPEVYENLFEPLFSTKGFGVGLGLPVVKQIMERHGGGVEVETDPGRGTKVCLWLPITESTI